MRVVTLKRLTVYLIKNPRAKIPLLYWYEIVKKLIGKIYQILGMILIQLIMWGIIDMSLTSKGMIID